MGTDRRQPRWKQGETETCHDALLVQGRVGATGKTQDGSFWTIWSHQGCKRQEWLERFFSSKRLESPVQECEARQVGRGRGEEMHHGREGLAGVLQSSFLPTERTSPRGAGQSSFPNSHHTESG